MTFCTHVGGSTLLHWSIFLNVFQTPLLGHGNTLTCSVTGAWVARIWFCGRSLPPPFQVSSPVPSFHRWYSPAIPHECRHTWPTLYNPSWTMTITNHSEAKERTLPVEQELDGYQAVWWLQPPQQRGKIRDTEATIHITQWYPRLQSYHHLLLSTLRRGPSPPQNIMDTRFFLRSSRLTSITMAAYQCLLPGPISILMDLSQESFRWETTIPLWDMFHPCTLVKGLLWFIRLPGMAGHPCILPQGMYCPHYTHPMDKWPRPNHQHIQCSLSLRQGNNLKLFSFLFFKNRVKFIKILCSYSWYFKSNIVIKRCRA